MILQILTRIRARLGSVEQEVVFMEHMDCPKGISKSLILGHSMYQVVNHVMIKHHDLQPLEAPGVR